MVMVHDCVVTTIEVRHLTKLYGTTVGAQDVSFTVYPGEVVGFLGPNGSGKTTVMRMLLGLIRPTSGEAFIFGELVNRHNHTIRSSVGYLPGILGVYKDMTVRGYLNYIATVRGVDCTQRMKELMQRLALKADVAISGLSKGTKQKVGVVQALMHDPKLLILDEPTAGLDPIVQKEFEAIISEVRARGTSVLLSSHVMSEVEQLADRVMILSRGRLVEANTITALKSRIRRSLRLEFPSPMNADVFAGISGVDSVIVDGRVVECTVSGAEAPLLAVAAVHDVISVTSQEPTLEDIFLSLTEQQ
jgi:ABC-2 type transport system ATP-binding protein